MLFLQVSLLEEFNEEQFSPVLAYIPLFSWVRNVCHMEHEPDELMLIFLVGYIKVFREHVTLEVSYSLEMVLHVSG